MDRRPAAARAAARELRALPRYRTPLVQERAAAVSRLRETLAGANIKPAGVATDLLGKSGRAMLAALVAGADDSAARAQLAAEIAERLRPVEEAVELLDAIPGVGRQAAEALVAELGTARGRFPSAKHLAAWAGMAPGNHASAGEGKSGKTRRGSPWRRATLVEAARAAVAVGHRLLVIAYTCSGGACPPRRSGPATPVSATVRPWHGAWSTAWEGSGTRSRAIRLRPRCRREDFHSTSGTLNA